MLDIDRVGALRAQGHSLRAIAAQLGASLGAVQRALKRKETATFFSDDGEGGLALIDADPDREVVPPLTYVGLERGSAGRVYARWVDTIGPVNDLEIYRHKYRDGSEGDDELEADMARQMVAAGWWHRDTGWGYWVWEPPGAGA